MVLQVILNHSLLFATYRSIIQIWNRQENDRPLPIHRNQGNLSVPGNIISQLVLIKVRRDYRRQQFGIVSLTMPCLTFERYKRLNVDPERQ